MIHMQYQGLLLPEIQESSVQFVMISVLRVKTKVVFISKPFQTPDKKIFDTDVYIALCMLDKFSYFAIFVMYNFMSRNF